MTAHRLVQCVAAVGAARAVQFMLRRHSPLHLWDIAAGVWAAVLLVQGA